MEMVPTSMEASGIQLSQSARIEVIGVGGGGSNAVNRMIMSDLEGVAYRVLNTDAQALIQSQADHRLQLGQTLTRGSAQVATQPSVKRRPRNHAPICMSLCRGPIWCLSQLAWVVAPGQEQPLWWLRSLEVGALTVGIVTKPFSFEGRRRMRQADEGISRLPITLTL